MILIPIAHEDHEGRRWPIATTLFVLINIAAFIATLIALHAQKPRITRAANAVGEYTQAHPYLRLPETIGGVAVPVEPPPDIRVLSHWLPMSELCRPGDRACERGVLAERAREIEAAKAAAVQARHRLPRGVEAEQAAAEQRQLDTLIAELAAAIDATPHRQFGYLPKEKNLLGLVTSQFMHGGVMHLVFNMWFMWLCACNLEDRWGKLVFVPFLLVSGVLAALAHGWAAPESSVPLVGASGAVAGAMGAFAVTHARTRISFFYFFVVRMGTFRASAWLALLMWAAMELASGLLTPAAVSGTAHWAHIGGFGFGAMVAVVLRVSGADKRLDAAVEAAVTVMPQHPRVTQALELLDGGRPADAIHHLEAALAERPRDADAWLTLLRAARDCGDRQRAAGAYAKLAGIYLAQGDIELAADMVMEAQDWSLGAAVPRALRLRIASAAGERGRRDQAVRICLAVLAEGGMDAEAIDVTVEGARLLFRFGQPFRARELLAAARESPAVDGRARARIDELLATQVGAALDL